MFDSQISHGGETKTGIFVPCVQKWAGKIFLKRVNHLTRVFFGAVISHDHFEFSVRLLIQRLQHQIECVRAVVCADNQTNQHDSPFALTTTT